MSIATASRGGTATKSTDLPETGQPLPWKTLKEEGDRVGISPRALARAAARGELQTVTINARGDKRLLPAWTDRYLLSLADRKR